MDDNLDFFGLENDKNWPLARFVAPAGAYRPDGVSFVVLWPGTLHTMRIVRLVQWTGLSSWLLLLLLYNMLVVKQLIRRLLFGRKLIDSCIASGC